VFALGLCIAAIAASFLARPAGRFDPVVGFIAGLAIAFTGGILVVPERQGRMRASLGALMITCIALLFDWIAFGSGVRTHVWEVPGRVLLVSGAMLFNLMALWAWIRARRVRRKTARA
jgi:hypothetical protein